MVNTHIKIKEPFAFFSKGQPWEKKRKGTIT